MAEERYLRGALVAFDPSGDIDLTNLPTLVIFRFNPKEINRSLLIECGKTASGVGAAADKAKTDSSKAQSADAATGTLRESFSVTVLFDLYDRAEFAQSILPDFGVSPEIAALESLVYPQPAEDNPLSLASLFGAAKAGAKAVAAREKRKLTLFIWGRSKVLPVRITSMTINETMHNPGLNPTRAEVTIGMEVLSRTDAQNPIARGALQFNDAKRQVFSLLYLATTADLIANVLPIP